MRISLAILVLIFMSISALLITNTCIHVNSGSIDYINTLDIAFLFRSRCWDEQVQVCFWHEPFRYKAYWVAWFFVPCILKFIGHVLWFCVLLRFTLDWVASDICCWTRHICFIFLMHVSDDEPKIIGNFQGDFY